MKQTSANLKIDYDKFYLKRDRHCHRYDSVMKSPNKINCRTCSHTANMPVAFFFWSEKVMYQNTVATIIKNCDFEYLLNQDLNDQQLCALQHQTLLRHYYKKPHYVQADDHWPPCWWVILRTTSSIKIQESKLSSSQTLCVLVRLH